MQASAARALARQVSKRGEDADERDGVATIGRLADDLDVLARAEQRLEPGANDEMIVGENHSDDVGAGHGKDQKW